MKNPTDLSWFELGRLHIAEELAQILDRCGVVHLEWNGNGHAPLETQIPVSKVVRDMVSRPPGVAMISIQELEALRMLLPDELSLGPKPISISFAADTVDRWLRDAGHPRANPLDSVGR